MIDRIHFGDCLEVMRQIPDGSVDMVLCDLPYGTTPALWDKPLSMVDLWEQYERIVKPSGAIVLFGSQPFSSLLVVSKIDWFRHEWVWDKVNAANFGNAKRQPLKQHEQVLVFGQDPPNYYPIKTPGKVNHSQGNAKQMESEVHRFNKRPPDDLSGLKFPKSILTYPKHSSHSSLHPTQKDLGMCEYLIRTYSLPGDVVLDNCIGSGTTALAARNTERRFIGIEKDPGFYKTACDRLDLESLPDWLL